RGAQSLAGGGGRASGHDYEFRGSGPAPGGRYTRLLSWPAPKEARSLLPQRGRPANSRTGLSEDRPHPHQILARAHAEGAIVREEDADRVAVLEGAELLEPLRTLEGSGRERGEDLEEIPPIPVDAHVGKGLGPS